MTDEETATAMSTRRRARWPWALGFAICALLAGWALLPWEWSTIDDPGFVLGIQSQGQDHGPADALVDQFTAMLQGDLSWGLFRPSYWAYPGLFYLLPVGLAHSVRLAMLLVAILGPLRECSRRGMRGASLAAAGAIIAIGASGLFIGLQFLSLQELSGAAFIGLGFAFRRRLPRVLLWTVAAWFKAPFAWLLIGYAIPLWRQGRRRMAVLSAGLGIVTIVLAALMARNGSYTTRFYRTTVGLIVDAIAGNGPKFFELPMWALLAGFAWWWITSRSRLRFDSESLALGIAALGFAINLLPWTVSGYYSGPVLYLVGLFLVSLLPRDVVLTGGRRLIALVGPLAMVLLADGRALTQVVQATSGIVGARDCILQTPPGSAVTMTGDLTYVATEEGAVRLNEIIALRAPEWSGLVTYTVPTPDLQPQEGQYVMWIGANPPSGLTSGTQTCRASMVTLVGPA